MRLHREIVSTSNEPAPTVIIKRRELFRCIVDDLCGIFGDEQNGFPNVVIWSIAQKLNREAAYIPKSIVSLTPSPRVLGQLDD